MASLIHEIGRLCRAGRLDDACAAIRDGAASQCPEGGPTRGPDEEILRTIGETALPEAQLHDLRQLLCEAGARRGGVVHLYHGTSSALLPGILEKGLVPAGAHGCDRWAQMNRRPAIVSASADQRPSSVYLADRATVTHVYAQHAAEVHQGSTAVVLALQIPAAVATRLEADELDEDARRFEGVIQPSWIADIRRVEI